MTSQCSFSHPNWILSDLWFFSFSLQGENRIFQKMRRSIWFASGYIILTSAFSLYCDRRPLKTLGSKSQNHNSSENRQIGKSYPHSIGSAHSNFKFSLLPGFCQVLLLCVSVVSIKVESGGGEFCELCWVDFGGLGQVDLAAAAVLPASYANQPNQVPSFFPA